MPKADLFIGVDYGSKLAGTTAICYEENGLIKLLQSKKQEDADSFLSDNLHRIDPHKVFIDAPLSLPAVYTGIGDDYFFRKADKECSAMSPMFLGGLTARAMRVQAKHETIDFMEVYPSMLAKKVLLLGEYYNKKNRPSKQALEIIEYLLPRPLQQAPENWHAFDAILAYITGIRFNSNKALRFGDADEGLIYV